MADVTLILASFPSPSSGNFDLGPVTLRAYGIMILLGIIAATWLGGRRWVARGGDWDGMFKVTIWVVAGGVVGARLYHVITSFDRLPDEWWGVFAIWRGGLGIWGAVAGGVLAGWWAARRHGYTRAQRFSMMDAVIPGVLLAQAIGRWGNWFNQELFGSPSTLPWALEVDVAHRPAAYATAETFHSIFLYESIWNLIGVVGLLWLDRRAKLRAPALFCVYVMWYTLARSTWEEMLRIDPSHSILGLRLNHYIAIGVFLLAAAAFWWIVRRGSERAGQPSPPAQGAMGHTSSPRMDVPRGRGRKR